MPQRCSAHIVMLRTFTTFDIIVTPNILENVGLFSLFLPLYGSTAYWLRCSLYKSIRAYVIIIAWGKCMYNINKAVIGFKYGTFIVFIFVFTLNTWGIIPYTLPASSHMSMTLPLAVLLWVSIIIARTVNIFNSLATYFPKGVGALGAFLIFIETIRSLIRPLTLSFRLAANITAGHVILGLLCASCLSLTIESHLYCIIFPVVYSMFEIIICFVQAYVFMVLIIIYSNDYYGWRNKLKKF